MGAYVKITWFLLLVSSAIATALAGTESYPSKPVKLIYGFPSGNTGDIRARAFAQRLTETLGQPFVVENRPGASGAIAAEAVIKAPADGYTILYGSIQELVFNPVLGASVRYDPLRDLAPISFASGGYPLLLVPQSLGVKSVAELVKLGTTMPGKLNCATTGHATLNHFGCAYFAKQAGIEILTVPYKGSAPAFVDASSGRVQMALGFVVESQPYTKSGKLVPLAVFGPRRLEAFPEVPTMTELGYPGLELFAWNCFMAPTGTPPQVVRRLNAEVIKVATRPDMVEWLTNTGAVVMQFTPEELGDFLRGEIAKWRKISDATGIKAE
ncbi:MAG TPA: tripartite tricarboxylate transporter substrate binding protein [Gemmatimonadales bacterium]|nr:tripartite tricarboxylate transporter substrate binding protein [Gemmatimonadales bacterium]